MNEAITSAVTTSTGSVFFYISSMNPALLVDVKVISPTGTFSHITSPTVGPILRQLSRRFPKLLLLPGRFRFDQIFLPVLNYYSDNQLYVWQPSKVWSIKGPMDVALEDNEEIAWITNAEGRLEVHVLIVCNFLFLFISN